MCEILRMTSEGGLRSKVARNMSSLLAMLFREKEQAKTTQITLRSTFISRVHCFPCYFYRIWQFPHFSFERSKFCVLLPNSHICRFWLLLLSSITTSIGTRPPSPQTTRTIVDICKENQASVILDNMYKSM